LGDTKPQFLDSLFEQIESQVQFGDSKASLLVAGNAILLAVNSGLITMVSGCQGNDFSVNCMVPSVSLFLATTAAALLTFSLACGLLAVRPAGIHDTPPPELFLLSHVAQMDPDAFAKAYIAASPDDLIQAALKSIHGKAVYAARKFRLLRRAIDATLLSLGFMAATLFVAVGSRILG
jgi:hypothetical protein